MNLGTVWISFLSLRLLLLFIFFLPNAYAEEEWTIDTFRDLSYARVSGEVTHGDSLNFFISKKDNCAKVYNNFTFYTYEKPGDIKIVEDSISVLVDRDSASYLKGCSVHFDDGLTGKGFEIKNPNASSTCGCGRSFN